MAANVKQVIGLPDGNVIVTYTDNSTQKKKATNATEEIKIAKQIGAYTQGNLSPAGSTGANAAFGTNTANGAATNVSGNPVVTTENLTAYYQQSLSSKSDGYSKIRKAMLDSGIISKGTRSLSSIANAWANVLQGAQAGGQDPFSYLNEIKRQGVGIDSTPSQKQTDYSQVTIYDPTKSKDLITQLSVNLLNREPSNEELTSLQGQLTKAQKKNASKTVYTKDKTGKTLATTTGGLDEQQFITDILKKSPDYIKVKEAGTANALQQIQDAAKANGIFVSPADAATYAERIRNGEKLTDIAATFRKITALSQPKAIQDLLNTGVDLADIYKPYKTAMAATLELDPNTIDLTDPALTGAINGDKTMTTYEFQRVLRKDPRWQYTNNARSEASNIATQVLKDFGFMR